MQTLINNELKGGEITHADLFIDIQHKRLQKINSMKFESVSGKKFIPKILQSKAKLKQHQQDKILFYHQITEIPNLNKKTTTRYTN